jgi:hypothetical protein
MSHTERNFYSIYFAYPINYSDDKVLMHVYRKSAKLSAYIKVGEIEILQSQNSKFYFGRGTNKPRVSPDQEEFFMKETCRVSFGIQWDEQIGFNIANSLLQNYLRNGWSNVKIRDNMVGIKRFYAPHSVMQVGTVESDMGQTSHTFNNDGEKTLFSLYTNKRFGNHISFHRACAMVVTEVCDDTTGTVCSLK